MTEHAPNKLKRKCITVIATVLITIATLLSLLVLVVRLVLPEQKYRAAVTLSETGQFEAAIEIFDELGDYKDSHARMVSLFSEVNRNVSVGSYVYFGAYEQDNDFTNGKEKIRWKVLSQNHGTVLLIAAKNLDSVSYHTNNGPVTWPLSSLRAWLNHDFLSAAFSEAEQHALLPTHIEDDAENASETPGRMTVDDRLFLLSASEAERLFADDSARTAPNTAYARSRNIFDSADETGWWWLRTAGAEDVLAASVNWSGSIDTHGIEVSSTGGGIRPAFRIRVIDLLLP